VKGGIQMYTLSREQKLANLRETKQSLLMKQQKLQEQLKNIDKKIVRLTQVQQQTAPSDSIQMSTTFTQK
jgi:TolA-binding protein